MRRKKTTFLSITLLLFSVVALTSSTLAWFGFATNAYVDGFDMTTSIDEFLDISLDGINYYSNISTEQIDKVIGKKLSLGAITTTNGIDFYGSYDNTNRAMPNIDYISFDLYFRSTNATELNLYLIENQSINTQYTYNSAKEQELDGTFVLSKGVKWTPDIDFDYGPTIRDFPDVYFAQDAIRIGIVEQQIEEEVLKQKDERTDLKVLIFDPSGNKERGFGALFGAHDYYEKRKSVVLEIPDEKPDTKYALSTFKNPYEARNNDSHIGTFQASSDGYYYTKIKVNIWLEGWDADCFDAIIGDAIIMQLKFRAAHLA